MMVLTVVSFPTVKVVAPVENGIASAKMPRIAKILIIFFIINLNY